MLLIKKPKFLEFVKETYDPLISKAAHKQVRHTENKSNTKLIVLKNGSMYIKVGKDYFKLRPITLPLPFKMIEKEGEHYNHVATIDTKYFMNEYTI
ncbi:hypothetical protein COBT_000393 [Conglomerata obtusa]